MPQELERRFLMNVLPNDLDLYSSQIIADRYFPQHSEHCQLRLRRRGDKFEITKKVPADTEDLSTMDEYTISLSESEYVALLAAPGKSVIKRRYTKSAAFGSVEIGVFMGGLEGLMIAEFEFTTSEGMKMFRSPAWVSIEITNDRRLAGGELCGCSIIDLEEVLAEYDYQLSPLIRTENLT